MRPVALPVAATLAAALALGGASAARAEVELSFYGGWQTAPHSGVSVEGADLYPNGDFTAGWEGRSFDMPPHYGLRATWWLGNDWGLGVEFNHVKVYADDETLAGSGFEHLEFTDGLNIATVNGMRRWPDALGGVTPYVGLGVGVAVPHVEAIDEDLGGRTWEYQVTGPAAAWMAGASYAVSDRWSVFGEYKGTWSSNDADLEGGGTLSTDIVTNALNVGVSFAF